MMIIAGNTTGTEWGGPIALCIAMALFGGYLLAVELRERYLAKIDNPAPPPEDDDLDDTEPQVRELIDLDLDGGPTHAEGVMDLGGDSNRVSISRREQMLRRELVREQLRQRELGDVGD